MRRTICILMLFVATFATAAAQSVRPKGDTSSRGIFGATLTSIPPLIRAHFPKLSKEQGLVVQSVAKASVAEKIGLHSHDILLQLDNVRIENVKQFSGVLMATSSGQVRRFGILRAGKKVTLSYEFQPDDINSLPKSRIKANAPQAVRLKADPLPQRKGEFKVTLTYYASGSKQQSFSCTGSVKEIESEVQLLMRRQQFPANVQDLVDVAVDRFREIYGPSRRP